MAIPEDYKQLLGGKGIVLKALGVNDIALERNDALLAVEFLRNAEVPILGGDVYLERARGIELAYANWHCDPSQDEDRSHYLQRSWSTAESYVKSYPEPADAKVLWAFVVGK